jgi:DNA-binding response OmpR family regulator
MKAMHILTIDDDPLMLDLLATYFSRCQQSRTCPVQDSEAAFKALERKPFDVILTDINHPGMDGLTFTRRVRSLNGPPVIVLSGMASHENRREAFASGAMACMLKPVKLSQLVEVIELVVDKGVRYIGTGQEGRRQILYPELMSKIQG